MKEKTQSEKAAADRQVELLTTALEKAKANGGVWLNAGRKLGPMLHRKNIGISGFNGLMLALASDRYNHATNLYTFYSDARNANSPVREHERGVPFNWYNWSEYVNKNDPDDTISREDYKKLPAAGQAQYKGVKQREIRWMFNIDQTILSQKDPKHYDNLVAKFGDGEARQVPGYDNDNALRIAVNDFQLKMKDNLVDIRRDGTGLNYYDADKNVIHISPEKTFADYPHFVQEIMRDVVAATGSQQRLAREGVVGNGSAADDDTIKQEKLIQELASAIKMQELGLPAAISKENMGMVDYWVRELKENPKLIDIVESDVNNAIDVIKDAGQGIKIEQASEVNAQKTQEYQEQMPKHYYVAEEIRTYPDKDNKLFVLVKDPQTKAADVILPQGASVERDNEIPGMNKDRIEHALKKQGYDTVRFYNIDGALGYKPDDSYFAGKELTVSRVKNWALEDISRLDASLAVEHSDKMEFDRVQMIQDDNRRWALYVKPEGKAAFAIYPDKADINRFFTTLKQSQSSMNDVRQELASKYYAMSEAKPELKVNIFGNEQVSEADLGRIQKVNIFKGRNDVILCAAEIEGAGKQEPKIVSPQQWQRMWLADDREAYKKNLAAKLFADVLQRTRPAEAKAEDKGKEKQAEVSVFANMSPHDIFMAAQKKIFAAEDGRELLVFDKNEKTGLILVRERMDRRGSSISHDEYTEDQLADVMRREKWNDVTGDIYDKVKALEGRSFVMKDGKTIGITNVDEKLGWVTYTNHHGETESERIVNFSDMKLGYIEGGTEITKKSGQEQEQQPQVEVKEENKGREDTREKIPWTWQELKKRHPTAMLMFRIGDNYKMYNEDALKGREILGTDVQKIRDDVDMTSFPHHMLDMYLPKLICSGCRVAICDKLPERETENKQVENQQAAAREEYRGRGMRR